MVTRLVISTLILVATEAFAQTPYSVTTEVTRRFVERCGQLPSREQMVSQISDALTKHRPRLHHAQVLLDGFRLEQINHFDFEVIKRLTSHRDMQTLAWKDFYRSDIAVEREQTTVTRYCLKPACQIRHRERPADLSGLNPAGACRDALCAAQTIFGKDRGVEILWAYLRYGVNLSPYSHVNADSEGFSDSQMRAILIALSAMPEHLRELGLNNFGFFRFLRGKTMAMYAGEDTIANAEGAVFDPIEKMDFAKMVYVFIHELGHRAARTKTSPLDESGEWIAARKGPELISKYAQTNGREDFAETFVLYRLDTRALKNLSPARYEFMRRHVFQNREYDQDPCGQL